MATFAKCKNLIIRANMPQSYHSNAVTNVHIRCDIRKSNQSNALLAAQYGISTNTVSKWKNRDSMEDRSSRPHNISYALTEVEETIICLLRKELWISREEIVEVVAEQGIMVCVSTVYRCLVHNGLNRKPESVKAVYGTFKEYQPGYLHIDVTYLPKIEGVRRYLFVAIDRATRLLFYRLYDEKSAENAADFLSLCRDFFPFEITTVMTDNGKEFSNKLFKGRSGAKTEKEGKFDQACGVGIDHRLTKPGTPKTNGMVERVNLTIKTATIHKTSYDSYDCLEKHLMEFLVFYNTNRRHGSLVKELKVKTPLDACNKWINTVPQLFVKNILQFGDLTVPLHHNCSLEQQ